MTVLLEINNCSECPHRHRPDMCSHPSRSIRIANTTSYHMKRYTLTPDGTIPKWCPLTSNNRIHVSGNRTV